MSQDDFKRFLSQANDDAALRNALFERFGSDTDVPAEQVIAFANENGYAFTVEEVQDELSDEALEGVAGGAGDYYLKLGDIEGESLSFDNKANKLQVRYASESFSFNFLKIGG